VLSNSRAVIISGYGMGNVPTKNLELMQMIKNAIEKDVIIVIKT